MIAAPVAETAAHRAMLVDVVDRADVGMIELRDRFRFARETLAELRIVGERARQHLDRDRTVEPRIACAIDLSHAAGAERRDDLVRTEPVSLS